MDTAAPSSPGGDGHPDISTRPQQPQRTANSSIGGTVTRQRSMSNASHTRQTSLGRQSSAGSITSRPRPTAEHSPPPAIVGPSITGKTHIGGIYPTPGFIEPRPPVVHPTQPAPTTIQDAAPSSGEILELNPLERRRSQDSMGSLAGSNQASTHPLTASSNNNPPGSTRRAGPRSFLSPLLPISTQPRNRKPTTTTGILPASSTAPKTEIRASFDKLFRRTSSDTKHPSPISPSRENSSSRFGFGLSRGARAPSPIDLEIGPMGRSSVPTSPTTPVSPGLPKTTGHPPDTSRLINKGFRDQPASPSFTDLTNPHTDHSHTFISHPTLADPSGLFPRATIPLNRSTSQSQPPSQVEKGTRKLAIKKNYHDYPSHNIFICDGKLVTGGGDSPFPFIATSILVLGLTGVWFGTTAVFWWHHSPGGIAVTIIGAYLALLTITNMFVTAFKDPGILPRNLDPEPPYPAWSHASAGDAEVQPLPRDILVKQNTLRVKYCTTCRTYRPPRAIHCRLCDNCVDGCDHHCQWLNTCVGRRNYTSFIAVLVFGSFTLIYVIVTAAVHISLIHLSFQEDLKQSIGSAVVFVLGILFLMPVGALFSYHIRLLLHNMTTVESLRTKAQIKLTKEQSSSPHSQSNTSLPRNPFQMKWYNNIAYLLCRPAGFDWIEAGEPQYRDLRLLNPGVMCEYRGRMDGDHDGDVVVVGDGHDDLGGERWTPEIIDQDRHQNRPSVHEVEVDPGYEKEVDIMEALKDGHPHSEHPPEFHVGSNSEDEHADALDELRDKGEVGVPADVEGEPERAYEEKEPEPEHLDSEETPDKEMCGIGGEEVEASKGVHDVLEEKRE